MIIQLIKNIVVPVVVLFVIVSSLILDKTPMAALLAVSGLLLVLSIILDARFPVLRHIQFVFLGLFHYFAHLNWAELLYFILIVIALQKSARIATSFLIASLYTLQYTLIRLSYSPINEYTLLVSVYDWITSLLVILLIRYVIHAEQEKKRLRDRTRYLSTHDALTGLLNYEGYLIHLQDFVDRRERFTLVTMDFQDFKSYTDQEANSENEILVNMSIRLKERFRDAWIMSRYAGDRFAIAIPDKDNYQTEIDSLMSSGSLGFQVAFSVCRFPQDAETAYSLITLAEDRLFHNKRNMWLLREELRFQEEKLKVVGELAAGMAHEIRNPLTTIKGFMQLSKSNAYNIQPWFDLVMSEISRMSELTAEFLQFAKPHISNMKPKQIQACLDRVVFLTEPDAALRGHQIQHEITEEALYILADRDKMVQVLLNLVRNAFEAMIEPGTVFVRLKRDGDSGLIEVEDTGIGIPESGLLKIFNPFYTTKDNGTGLGLSICKKIIQDHGGSLVAESVVGKGSLFRIRLPLLQADPV